MGIKAGLRTHATKAPPPPEMGIAQKRKHASFTRHGDKEVIYGSDAQVSMWLAQ